MSEELRSGVQTKTEMMPAGYYSFEGAPVEIEKQRWPQFVTARGKHDVEDISAFMHNGRPISKEIFDELVEKTRKR